MPPSLDVYIISSARDRETIERFLNTYVNRAASEDRGNEELMMLPLGSIDEPATWNEWDWEPARSLTHIVQRGLQEPRRAFVVYLKPQDNSLEEVTLGFTVDNQVIFGICLDDEAEEPDNLERAKRLLHEIVTGFEGRRAFIGVDMPSPLLGTSHPRNIVVYSWIAE